MRGLLSSLSVVHVLRDSRYSVYDKTSSFGDISLYNRADRLRTNNIMSTEVVTESISNIRIGDAQRKLESTPTDLIPVPQTSGDYVVDTSVIAGT